MVVVRQVVRTDYLTSRLHRKGRYRSTIWVDVMTKTTAAPKGCDCCPESLYRCAEPFLQGKPLCRRDVEDVELRDGTLSKYATIAAANHSGELLSTISP